MMRFLRMRWLFNRRIGRTLLGFMGLGLVAFIVNLVGIRIAGDVQEWSAWLKDHAPIFLIWRLCLYGAVGYGWWWMRRRIIARENNPNTKSRFARIEVSTVFALITLELCNWFT